MNKLTTMKLNPKDTKQLSAMLDYVNGTAEFERKLTISSVVRDFIKRCTIDPKFYKDFINGK